MKKIKSIKLKDKYVNILKITGVILCIFLGIFIFFRKQINDLKKYGYSEKASYNILFSFKKDYILSKGENKTLNAAFESKDYNENNLDRYAKINYVKQDNLIKNINKLIKIGYSNDDIDLILTHGDATAVERFIKRDKVNMVQTNIVRNKLFYKITAAVSKGTNFSMFCTSCAVHFRSRIPAHCGQRPSSSSSSFG